SGRMGVKPAALSAAYIVFPPLSICSLLEMRFILLVIGPSQPLAQLAEKARPFFLERRVCGGMSREHTSDLREDTRTGYQGEDQESDGGWVERSLDVSLGLALTDFVHVARHDLAALLLVDYRTIPHSQRFTRDKCDPLLIFPGLGVVVDEI